VLTTVQALLGMVPPELKGVALQFSGDDITIHLAVAVVYDSLEEDIDDIVSDMEGLLLPESPTITTTVHVGSARTGWDGRKYRLVFLAKD
jgi:hypothetical protein